MSTPDLVTSCRPTLHSATSELILDDLGQVGRNLGKYRVLLELARGGMGVVSLAVLRGPGGFHKLLAVKELRAEFVRTPALVAMFLDEARLAARLSHPNIVQTVEVGVEDDRPFLAMEFLDGQPLRQVVQRALALSMRIPLRAHLGILLDVLSALDHAHGLADFDGHALGVVHRDVSPHNVVLTYDGQVKLVDFGCSKAARPRDGERIPDLAAPEERVDVVMGKARYMAPEQVSGGPVDRRADVFAVGVMMWEAIVGKRPWEGQPDAAVLQSLVSGELPRMMDAWPDVDPGLGAIVDRAMSARPDERYPTAHAMRADLERYIASRNLAPQSARSLGASVCRLFADDREKLRSVIDAKIRALGAGDAARSSTIPRLAMTLPAASAPSSAEASGEHLRVPAGSSQPVASPSPPAVSSVTPASVAVSVGEAPVGPHTRRPPRGVAAIAFAAAAVGAAMAFLGAGVARSRTTESPSAAHPRPALGGTVAGAELAIPAPSVAPALPAVPVGAARTTRTIVVASPPSARIYLDDLAVSNPFVADHAADAVAHRLRVEAPGYEAKTRVLTFAEDVQLELDLAPTPSPPPAYRAPKADRVERPSPPDPTPPRRGPGPADGPTTPRAPRPIDTGDPYLR